jgi:SAM-dependent methyltransferase
MTYPDYNTYTKLYGRYLKKGPERFFSKANPEGKSVLDLCAGGGQLSKYALEHGATNVLMVDLARQMLDPDFKGLGRTNRIETEVEGFLACNKIQYDIVVCRQAVNYWFKNVEGEDIARMVKKGGMFVFNTFGNKPSETPTVREYYHEGVAYKELSYLIDGKIYHTQAATGIPPHFTVFDWISWEEYSNKLAPYFNIEEMVEGPSSMWYCWKV